MKREMLKSLALKAKNRMIHKTSEPNDGVQIKVIQVDDELFYTKVKSLLENDADIINPIKKLMDENLMMRLDSRGREKYLLETVEKYHAIRKRIGEENSVLYGLQA